MSGVRLNVGAGAATVPGWLNLDASPTLLVTKLLPSPLLGALAAILPVSRRGALQAYAREGAHLVWGDARRGLPLADGAADAVYTSHFLEHVRRTDALRFLRECHRVLRPGGVLRIVVPDLRRLARQYLEGEGGRRLTADEFLSATMLAEPERPGLVARALSTFLDRASHLWMYDVASLSALLCEAGFAEPRERAFREGLAPDLEQLDLAERAAESLYLEAAR